MKKEDAAKYVHVHASLGEKVEAHACDALRELWDRTVDDATADPESRRVTPSMVKAAVEKRLRDLLGATTLLPVVEVKVNADRTGFDIEISPAKVEPFVLRQVR